MPTRIEMEAGKKEGILRVDIQLDRPQTDVERFSRAELIFTGVDHSTVSYEVRVFLNNPDADEGSSRTEEEGYAGRFVVFAHGGCYGGVGHCDVPSEPRAPHDLRRPHALTRKTKVVDITEALRRVLANEPYQLRSVTLVPISKGAEKGRRGLTKDLFQFDAMKLRSYAQATASELGLPVDYDL
jgi:hypothetical protein